MPSTRLAPPNARPTCLVGCGATLKLIGASLSEPHIDEMNARNPYIIIIIIMYGTSVTRNYIPSDLYGHKREIFYCAFSCLGHGPYIRRSDLANCKFTLVLALIKQAQCVQH